MSLPSRPGYRQRRNLYRARTFRPLPAGEADEAVCLYAHISNRPLRRRAIAIVLYNQARKFLDRQKAVATSKEISKHAATYNRNKSAGIKAFYRGIFAAIARYMNTIMCQRR